MSDYIIIGSGSAGSVMAKRLTDAGFRVAVLEYGGSDIGPFIQMPAALSYPMNMRQYDWGYMSEPEPHLKGRRLACPRGKVIGGSSSINGMIYVRGAAGDYDYWAESGAHGWSYADVLPYFKRMESATHNAGCHSDWRGADGELRISRAKMQNPLFEAFIRSAEACGYHRTEDYNGYRQEGFGATQFTTWRGQRYSAARAFLRPALKNGKLRLITRALAEKILWDGKRAIGVQYKKRGKSHKLMAKTGVIIAAGAINSPKLLMLSGVGKAQDLRTHNIDVVLDRQGVGENLQDHLELYLQMQSRQPVSLYPYLNPISKAMIFLQWFLARGGLGSSPQFESVGFIRSAAGVPYPDIQYHFLPVAVRYDGKAAAKCHSFQTHVGPMRSASRGFVKLRSSDPQEAPIVQFNYMSDAQDWRDFRNCIRLTREILRHPSMADYSGKELSPGDDKTSDAALDDFIADNVESAYHPCGTCKMGRADDALAVVDPACRVIGTESLWLADSSIFPRITNGNLNAPSIMSGDKAADHILGKPPLPADNRGTWQNPNWQNCQR